MAGRKATQGKATRGSTKTRKAEVPAKRKKHSIQKKSQASRAAIKDQQPSALTQKASRGFPIVGIGASAGGLEALEELFGAMPADTGLAFVVVTHQHPGHTSVLPELIGRHTGMPVREAGDGMKLQPNHVYVCPPGGYLSILNRKLHRLEMVQRESPRLPIDYFFHSLADDLKEMAICIVLSGTGTDGTQGMRAIKAGSGMGMAQEPRSAKYSGMPASAIATGLADYVLPPGEMPQQLVAYAQGPYLRAVTTTAEMSLIPAEPLQKIFVLLRDRTGQDFSSYKSSTIHRRIERRMNLHQIQKPDDYVRYLQENPQELDILFKEMLISVTSFFRDPEAWEAFRPRLEELVKSRPDNHTLRVWVPACATGEEAFSLIIELQECMDRINRHLPLQIFGTDLDADAIATARAGQYLDGIATNVSPERLKRYFTREDGTYRVRKEIRDMAIFAPQNVIKDPPFTRLDLISCRNFLIYLNGSLQKKVLAIFRYALKPGGLLFLGPSETIGASADLFNTLDKRWKIFRRRESAATLRSLPEISAQPLPRPESVTAFPGANRAPKETRLSTYVERLLLNRFVPTTVVVNERGEIRFIHGRTGEYLEAAEGEPRNNLLDMVREGLQIELPSAMRECMKKGKDVTRENVRVKTNGKFIHANLTVSQLTTPEALRGLLLVTFRPTPPSLPARARAKGIRKNSVDTAFIERLERELQYTKESHQTTLEELETSNEELKSTNEELQSINEELQSTNEELETSREEMQSLNEEVTTVNAELQSTVDELSRTNDDMQNLLNSTYIATMFLDNDLNVKRFTAQASELIMLRETDIGRPISELASTLVYDDLAGACRKVLKTLAPKEGEVRANDGRWFLMRIMPYRTADNVIDGLVLTFVDIGPLKRTEEVGERALSLFKAIVETVREPLIVLTGELRVFTANRAFYHTFRTTMKQTEGELIYELGLGQWDIPELRRLLEDILPKDLKFEDYEVNVEVPRLGRRVFVLNARRLSQQPYADDMILLALEDMTRK